MPRDQKVESPQNVSRAGALAGWLCIALATMILAALFATPGAPDVASAIVTVLYLLMTSGAAAALWLAGAIGFGRALLLLLRVRDLDSRLVFVLETSLGAAIALWLAHLLGSLGLFWMPFGRVVAWGIPIAGVALLVMSHRSGLLRCSVVPRLKWLCLCLAPAAALLIVCASNPPGALWESEAHGHDVLSYHLQFVKEWHDAGRIQPLNHNVYAFFPSYVESAYAQLAAMLTPRGESIIAGDALALHAAQFLHVGMAILAALCVTALCGFLIAQAKPEGTRGNSTAPILAGAFFLCVPWIMVVGSLAYNEAAVLLGFVGALSAVASNLKASTKSLLVGILVAAAAGAKLTAIPWLGFPIGVLLLVTHRPRDWPRVFASGLIGVMVVLTPWLIRNAEVCSNPLFPFGARWLGACHWTAEQAERWAIGHGPEGGLLHRLGLLMSDRGIFHDQWSIVWAVVIVSSAIVLTIRVHRRVGTALVLTIAVQCALWTFIGHQQSRFLIPILVPAAILFGLSLHAVVMTLKYRWPRRLALLAWAGIVFGLLLAAFSNFLHQRAAAPNSLLVGGVRQIRGDGLIEQLESATHEDRQHIFSALSSEAFVNTFIAPQPDARLCLAGDATPLYYDLPVLYSTTWDAWPIGDALEASGGDATAAIAALHQRGATHLLINLSEIARLEESGWNDPRFSTEAAAEFLQMHAARIIHAWSDRRRALYLLDLSPSGPAVLRTPDDRQVDTKR